MGSCIAAEYIKTGGREACAGSKRRLLREVNELLSANDMPTADKLCELPGSFVDLAYTYPLPSGVAIICSCGIDGSLPELAAYKRR